MTNDQIKKLQIWTDLKFFSFFTEANVYEKHNI